MAMLAEPKRKVKWSLNPRGKWWSEDDSKLGQRLLEKMGWSKGKGLGKYETGVVEPIRVEVRNENAGLGFRENTEAWTAHNSEYEDLLKNLQEQATSEKSLDDCSVSNAEINSKNSKKRFRYQKRFQGKDLSNYSSKDLQSILGTKVNVGSKDNDDFQSVGERIQDNEKLEPPRKKSKLNTSDTEDSITDEESNEEESTCGFTLSTKAHKNLNGLNGNMVNERKAGKSLKKCKKKKSVSFLVGDIFHKAFNVPSGDDLGESSKKNDEGSQLDISNETDNSKSLKKRQKRKEEVVECNGNRDFNEEEDYVCNSAVPSCSKENDVDPCNSTKLKKSKKYEKIDNQTMEIVAPGSVHENGTAENDEIRIERCGPVKKSLYKKWIKRALEFTSKDRLQHLLQLMDTVWDNEILKTTNIHLIKGYPR